MFAKVFQYPPRHGNGSYWTLLADGEEELKRAHPLFTTLLPPVIDADSAYCRIPLTHTVKSRGQFTPVLPHKNHKVPYLLLWMLEIITGASFLVEVDNEMQLYTPVPIILKYIICLAPVIKFIPMSEGHISGWGVCNV